MRRCCRSTPRCDGCPVRLVAAARDTTESAGVAALVEEIFTGRSARPLPRCVAEALDALERRPANITAADAVQR